MVTTRQHEAAQRASDQTERTLKWLLCSRNWTTDDGNESYIRFNGDGGGYLHYGVELCRWIAADIEWRNFTPTVLDQIVNIVCVQDQNPKHKQLAELAVEVTLTKRRRNLDPTSRINERVLREEAFLPKTYNVTIEQGSFVPTCALRYWADCGYVPEVMQMFRLCLTFDCSPYPQPEEWKSIHGGPRKHKMWEVVRFTNGRICLADERQNC